jgi:hypothetical protein
VPSRRGPGRNRELVRQLPACRPRSCVEVGTVGGRPAQEQGRQLAPPAAAAVLDLGLRLGVAVDGVGGELVDVGEDRLGEQRQRLRLQLRPPARRGDPPPGDPGADPVGGLQRIERPSLPLLAATELDVDLPPGLAAGVGISDQGDEPEQRLADAGADAAAEAALQRPLVLGHLAGDRRQDLLGDRPQFRLDQVGDRG